MPERGGAAMQAGTGSLTKPFPPLPVPSRVAVVVIDLYLLCSAKATGADESNAHARELQWNKVKNGRYYASFPRWFDTVITVHLQEKLYPRILLYPSICEAHCVPAVIFVLSFIPPVYPLVSSATISVITFLPTPTCRALSGAPGGGMITGWPRRFEERSVACAPLPNRNLI